LELYCDINLKVCGYAHFLAYLPGKFPDYYFPSVFLSERYLYHSLLACWKRKDSLKKYLSVANAPGITTTQ
jgi:hypothetical protein